MPASSISQAATLKTPFVRRTYLEPDEYQADFTQIDNEVLRVLKSPEARQVTNLMSHIYISLKTAPAEFWERQGVLRFAGEERGGEKLTAWQRLCDLCDVASATLSRALKWLHERGIIGYSASGNGWGIRIFLNRAARSIRRLPPQKNLRLVPTSIPAPPTSKNEVAFKDDLSKSVQEVTHPHAAPDGARRSLAEVEPKPVEQPPPAPSAWEVAALVRSEVADQVNQVRREVTDLREWLNRSGMPKVARVAMAETFRLLRSAGLVPRRKGDGGLSVGAAPPPDVRPPEARDWHEAARNFAEVAALHGVALADELAGYVDRGDISAEDAARVRAAALEIGLITTGGKSSEDALSPPSEPQPLVETGDFENGPAGGPLRAEE
jgi:hypothetical protein